MSIPCLTGVVVQVHVVHHSDMHAEKVKVSSYDAPRSLPQLITRFLYCQLDNNESDENSFIARNITKIKW